MTLEREPQTTDKIDWVELVEHYPRLFWLVGFCTSWVLAGYFIYEGLKWFKAWRSIGVLPL